MLHHAVSVQKHSQRRVERVHQSIRDRDGSVTGDHVITEEVVHAHTESLVSLHPISHAIPNVPGVTPPLLVHSVRHLTLVEVRASTLASPRSQVLQGVLHCQTIHGHIIPSDVHPSLAWVICRGGGPSRGVIRPPQPQVVSHHIAGCDVHHGGRLHVRVPSGTSNATKHIRNHSWVLRRTLVLSGTPLHQSRTGNRAGFQDHSRHSHTIDVTNLNH
mmetsp:Transcript_44131/g.93915  ORF Transcript_44131/g.93915 Transcript_44131/m.93915 type:complete len:216 (+) Transcript_44131:637-1284(+)